MREIDADKLIERMKEDTSEAKKKLSQCEYVDKEVWQRVIQIIESYIDIIDNLPSTYDVDKVVEQLEELQHYACFPTEWVTEEQQPVYKYFKDELTKILDLIVKAGGIDES